MTESPVLVPAAGAVSGLPTDGPGLLALASGSGSTPAPGCNGLARGGSVRCPPEVVRSDLLQLLPAAVEVDVLTLLALAGDGHLDLHTALRAAELVALLGRVDPDVGTRLR